MFNIYHLKDIVQIYDQTDGNRRNDVKRLAWATKVSYFLAKYLFTTQYWIAPLAFLKASCMQSTKISSHCDRWRSELQIETSKQNLVNWIHLTGWEKTILNRQNPQNIRMSMSMANILNSCTSHKKNNGKMLQDADLVKKENEHHFKVLSWHIDIPNHPTFWSDHNILHE